MYTICIYLQSMYIINKLVLFFLPSSRMCVLDYPCSSILCTSTPNNQEYIYFYYRYSALGPVWAKTRAQSDDWYGSGMLYPGQVLRGSLPLLSPTFRLPTFATMCLHVHHDARDPNGGRWNCGRECCPVILPK